MTQNEFVVLYVGLPLAIAVGWLLWRGRYLLRNILLYAVAIAVLMAVVRLGHLAWLTWEDWAYLSSRRRPILSVSTLRLALTLRLMAHAGPDTDPRNDEDVAPTMSETHHGG